MARAGLNAHSRYVIHVRKHGRIRAMKRERRVMDNLDAFRELHQREHVDEYNRAIADLTALREENALLLQRLGDIEAQIALHAASFHPEEPVAEEEVAEAVEDVPPVEEVEVVVTEEETPPIVEEEVHVEVAPHPTHFLLRPVRARE